VLHVAAYKAIVGHWHANIRGSTYIQPGRDSSVGIATGYGLDGSGIESRWGRDFPHLFRPDLGPTQPPVKWIPGLSPGVKSGRGVTLTLHHFLVPWSWKSRAIPILPLWAVRSVQSLSACTVELYLYSPYGVCVTLCQLPSRGLGFSRRPLNAEGRFLSQAGPCGIFGGRSDAVTCLPPSTCVFVSVLFHQGYKILCNL
jgi:hypothetical protein